MNTEMGNIAGALAAAKEGDTPLQIKLNQLSKVLTILVVAISAVIFGVGVVRGVGDGFAFKDDILPAMSLIREDVDTAESITASDYWPYPSYGDILFSVQ